MDRQLQWDPQVERVLADLLDGSQHRLPIFTSLRQEENIQNGQGYEMLIRSALFSYLVIHIIVCSEAFSELIKCE